MKILNALLLPAVICFLAGCSTTEDKKTLSELDVLLQKIEHAADPNGVGKNIRSLRIIAESELVEQNMKVHTVITFRFPHEMKETVKLGTLLDVSCIYNGEKGVEITKGLGSRALTPAEMNSKKFEIMTSDPRLHFSDVFDEVTLAPEKVTVNGKPCYHLTGKPLKSLNLAPVQMYFDAETYLMVRQDFIAPTQMGNVPMTSETSDYKEVDGLFFSTRATTKFLGTTMNTVVEKVELNPSLGADEFKVSDDDE